MTEKHTVIDERKIYDLLYSRLEEAYSLSYTSYDSEIQPETLDKILKEGLQDNLYDIFSDQTNYYAREELDKLIDTVQELTEDQKDLFKQTYEYLDLVIEIKSRDESDAEKDIFVKSHIQARVALHSNYDCWPPLWAAGGLKGNESALEGMMKALSLNPAKVKQEALKNDIDCFGSFPNLKYRDGKEIVSYEGFVKCLLECPNYALFSFFGEFDMKALWATGLYDTPTEKQFDSLVIPAGTKCTMFNDWNGGGSLEFTETLRDVTIGELRKRASSRYDHPAIYVDERFKDAHGYSSGEVYGGHVSTKTILTSKAS